MPNILFVGKGLFMIKASPEEAKKYFYAKTAFSSGPVEVAHMPEVETNIIDVREEKDYAKGHVPRAKNLPRSKWQTLAGLDKDKLNIIYCYSAVCHLAAQAALEFADKGYRVMEMDGGFEAWKAHHFKIEKAKAA